MSKSSLDAIWASMNEEVAPKKIPDFEKLQKAKKSTKKKAEVNDPLKIYGAKKEKAAVVDVSEDSAPATTVEPVAISLAELQPKLTKEINAISDSNQVVRKNGLQNLHRLLFVEHKLTEREYSELFHDVCRPVFKRFADPVEKCRDLAQRLTKAFFERAVDIVPVLAYYFPALMQRIPPNLGYDDEMKVFVLDPEAHNAYKRGKAVERQDKAGAVSGQSTIVVEPSEEIRFLACDALLALLQRVHALGAYPILHPYFEEIIIYLQLQLRDPYPELKGAACHAFETLACIPDYELGLKYYAIAICRAILPVLRHRHAKVRAAAVAALHYVMVVPDRAKRKGSGTDAIQDLVGFREENILPIAAFYKDDVQVNYLAELVGDKSPQVREKLVEFLNSLLTVIDDRYDHQTRLLPYLLDLMTDEFDTIADNAYRCLQVCGKQYEDEHTEEILEKRQYGIDGDDRINLDKPLPKPFTERPRIGMRMYVRGNSKRFSLALVNELTNWIAPTRLKSGNLLKLVIVLCEEHSTMEMHAMLPQLMKALKFARDDKDVELQVVLGQVFELLGRYILPEIYLYYILPRLRGDPNVQPFGIDADTRVTAMEMLSALLEGSKANTIVPHFQELVQTLTDPFVISQDSTKQQSAAMRVLRTVLSVLQGKSKQAIEAYYVATGRITSLQVTIRQIFRYLLLQMSTKELRQEAWQVLTLLAKLETDPVAVNLSSVASISRLFFVHGSLIVTEEINRYEVDAAWSIHLPEHQVILRLLEYPAYVIQQDTRSVRMLLAFICESVRSLRSVSGSGSGESSSTTGGGMVIRETGASNGAVLSNDLENNVASALNSMLMRLLQPILSLDLDAVSAGNSFAPMLAATTNAHEDKESLSSLFHSEAMHARLATTFKAIHSEQDVVDELLQVMCLSARWSRSPSLNVQRIELLQLLLGQATSSADDEVVEDRFSTGIVHPSLLIHHATALTSHIAAVSLIPATIESVRLSVVHLLAKISSTIRNFSGLTKVLPASKVAARLDSADTATAPYGFSNRQHFLTVKGSQQMYLYHLLHTLDDASDDVRAAAADALLHSLPLVFTNAEEVEDWKRLVSPAATVVLQVQTSLTFEALIRTLFQKCVIELDKLSPSHPLLVDRKVTEQFVDVLDTSLRMICVLHPIHFEQVVRTESLTILARSQEELTDRIVEFMNGLVNHADILSSMS
jgi:hypothetical protein